MGDQEFSQFRILDAKRSYNDRMEDLKRHERFFKYITVKKSAKRPCQRSLTNKSDKRFCQRVCQKTFGGCLHDHKMSKPNSAVTNFSNSASHTPRQFYSPWHVIPGVTAALMGNLGRTTRLWGSDPWTRDTWIVTGDIFQTPPPFSPPLLPLTPSSWCIQPEGGGRGGEAWTPLWPSAPSSTAAAAPMHLPTYSWNPTQPRFPFSIPNISSLWKFQTHSWLVWIYSGERAIADRRWFGRVEKGHCREYGGQFLGNFASSSVQEKSQPDPLLGDLQEERAWKSWGFYQSLG